MSFLWVISGVVNWLSSKCFNSTSYARNMHSDVPLLVKTRLLQLNFSNLWQVTYMVAAFVTNCPQLILHSHTDTARWTISLSCYFKITLQHLSHTVSSWEWCSISLPPSGNEPKSHSLLILQNHPSSISTFWPVFVFSLRLHLFVCFLVFLLR